MMTVQCATVQLVLLAQFVKQILMIVILILVKMVVAALMELVLLLVIAKMDFQEPIVVRLWFIHILYLVNSDI